MDRMDSRTLRAFEREVTTAAKQAVAEVAERYGLAGQVLVLGGDPVASEAEETLERIRQLL